MEFVESDNDNVVRLFAYDGQTIWADRGVPLYEVGNFLGGGAAGTVYECEHNKSRDHFALKILNPIGFKMLSPVTLKRCNVVSKGKPVSDALERCQGSLSPEHVWWLINGATKQYVGAYFSEKANSLKEFSLVQCMQLWGADPAEVNDNESGTADSTMEVLQCLNGPKIVVPAVPPKYADFVRKRRRIFREIRNMRKISAHKNVIRLENVLELNQDSKCTIFLVMELANGGELFDRIKLDCGAREDTAKLYFQQLLEGVRHCHQQGVCHRDLKPEVGLYPETTPLIVLTKHVL
jgi:serine/threonine protein kinase